MFFYIYFSLDPAHTDSQLLHSYTSAWNGLR